MQLSHFSTMSSGLFISFEGIDGAGKSTHIAGVAELFRAAGRQVVLTREPGGTPMSEQLRELVLHTPMDPLTEALLMYAARREHLVQVIEPALARGEHQERLGQRVHGRVQHQLAQLLGQRRATGLAGEHHRPARFAKARSHPLDVGGFASTVDAFEADEKTACHE